MNEPIAAMAWVLSASVVACHAGVANGQFDYEVGYVFSADRLVGLFGSRVSGAGDIDADGFDDLIVSTPVDATNGQFSGTARVYSGATGEELRAVSGDPFDRVGQSISAAGDINNDGFDDFIVGASNEVGPVSGGSGVVRVYSGASGEELLALEGTSVQGSFGFSVTGLGDINGDGVNDLIAGDRSTPSDSFGPIGRAVVYSGSTGEELFAYTGSLGNEAFGTSVSGAGDVNKDGIPDFGVGAPGFGSAFTGVESVTIYSGNTGEELFTLLGSEADESFGTSISSAGDVNGDGFDDMIVGAPGGDSGTSSAYIFSGATGEQLHRFSGNGTDSFGISVSGIGDVDGDGYDDVIIGAPEDDTFGTRSGSVSIFSGVDGSLITRYFGSSDSLGSSVSDAGDVNGDNKPDFIIGAAIGRHAVVYGSVPAPGTTAAVALAGLCAVRRRRGTA